MTTLRTLSTIDTNQKKNCAGQREIQHVCNTIRIDDQGRTSGGIPLITGIKRMYKNSAIVIEPDSADTPTNNL